ncbi:hypothetical protein, partial [Terasakiella sp.]|uniref:hypothetical protein n=1 Tax=Terasakiella sp. TaxID=2034861 RepID=UPI003AA890C9
DSPLVSASWTASCLNSSDFLRLIVSSCKSQFNRRCSPVLGDGSNSATTICGFNAGDFTPKWVLTRLITAAQTLYGTLLIVVVVGKYFSESTSKKREAK